MAKQKRKVAMPAGIRNKMMAAVSMLMVSSIMMVSSTYAWFTLSTAPEVKNISTTVAGNGSLEIALMPKEGDMSLIAPGTAGSIQGNTDAEAVRVANNSWGNMLILSEGMTDYYGLKNISLYPAKLNLETPLSPLKTAKYGNDGRLVEETDFGATVLKASVDGAFTGDGASIYGVRSIVEEGAENDSNAANTAYGYVIDFAVRLNTTNTDGTNGSLLLQTIPRQRIYTDGTNSETLGSGSCMKINTIAEEIDAEYVATLLDSIRVTFVQNYGLKGTNTIKELGTARLATEDVEIKADASIPLYLYEVNDSGADAEGIDASVEDKGDRLEGEAAVLIDKGLIKNAATQISAIVWMDGDTIGNSGLAASVMNSMTTTLNLQFATDVELHPAQNSALKTAVNE